MTITVRELVRWHNKAVILLQDCAACLGNSQPPKGGYTDKLQKRVNRFLEKGIK